MPFKSSKISYGLPQDDYPKERMNDCITDFKEVLGLKSELVGVRFIFDESEYAALEADEPSVPIPYCVMVKSAVQGNTYESGIKPKIDMGAMQGMCSEATVVPYISGEINVSVLCPSTRMLCKWDESDMAVGIPFERFEPIVRGIMATQMKY